MMIMTKIYPSDSLVSLVSYQNFQGISGYKGVDPRSLVFFFDGIKECEGLPKSRCCNNYPLVIFFYHYDIALSNYFKDFIQLPATYENISENYSVLH